MVTFISNLRKFPSQSRKDKETCDEIAANIVLVIRLYLALSTFHSEVNVKVFFKVWVIINIVALI